MRLQRRPVWRIGLILMVCAAAAACEGEKPAEPVEEKKPEAGAPTSSPTSSPASSVASQKFPEKLEGAGTDGRYHFKLTLIPKEPKLGEMFKAEVLLTDSKTGAVVKDAEVKVDATMPEHRHGMMTAATHKALGEGKYLTEGMKLHMPGSWEFRIDAKGEAGEDHLKLRYNQKPVAKE